MSLTVDIDEVVEKNEKYNNGDPVKEKETNNENTGQLKN